MRPIRPLAVLSAAAIACLLLSAPAAHAGRDPTPEERARVETVLWGMGFARWDDIELEDGVWEIDDARSVDGKKYELRLHPETSEVIEREED